MQFCLRNSSSLIYHRRIRYYSYCCPPRRPAGTCGCPPTIPGAGEGIKPPTRCRPTNIPANPCCPRFHKGNYKKFKYIFFFLSLPLILFQLFNVMGHATHPHKGECRDFEYMRLRYKKYPWRDGVQTLFHNDDVNHVPGECTPPPLDCDD